MTQNVAAGFDPRLASSGPFIPEANFNPSPEVLLWVNAATAIPEADQNGSEAAPYSNVNTAADALPNEGGVLMVVQGDYSSQTMSVLGASAGDKPVRAVAWGAERHSTVIRRATSNAPLALENMLVNEFITITGGFDVELVNCLIGGAITCENLRLYGDGNVSGVVGLITLTGALRAYRHTIGAFEGATNCYLNDCIVTGEAQCDNLVTALNSTFANALDTNNLDAFNCAFNATINIAGSEATMRQCSFSAAVPINFAAPGGVITCDAQTYGAALAAGVAVTNGAFVVESRNQSVEVTITVPALAGGEMALANGSLVGTSLEGVLSVGAPVLVCPKVALATAGAGQGGPLGVGFVSGANTVRCAFLGQITGGDTVFNVTAL